MINYNHINIDITKLAFKMDIYAHFIAYQSGYYRLRYINKQPQNLSGLTQERCFCLFGCFPHTTCPDRLEVLLQP